MSKALNELCDDIVSRAQEPDNDTIKEFMQDNIAGCQIGGTVSATRLAEIAIGKFNNVTPLRCYQIAIEIAHIANANTPCPCCGGDMTVATISKEYRITRSGVHDAIQHGRLPARQDGATWLVRRKDVEAQGWAKRE
jgi:hypothetical protein